MPFSEKSESFSKPLPREATSRLSKFKSFSTSFSISSNNYVYTDKREKMFDGLYKEAQRFWEINDHCSTLLFPKPYPDFQFTSPSSDYYYLLHSANGVPNQELVSLIRQVYYRVLEKLNQVNLQVRNFILPVELMKLKYIDPDSKQRIIEALCKYFSFQTKLKCVILEQADVTFVELCRILVALAQNRSIRKLYLWNALNKCEFPFKGPLKSNINLDDLPRIPYTYNPGGRKYLKKLQESKNKPHPTKTNSGIKIHDKEFNVQRKISDQSSKKAANEKYLREELHISSTTINNVYEIENNDNSGLLLKVLSETNDNTNHVYSQLEVGLQCNMSRESINEVSRFICKNTVNKTESIKSLTSAFYTKTRLDFCEKYLKYYKNCDIEINIQREIFMITLNRFINLTTLSIDYGLLADGTGNALLSIGSVIKGRLEELELLCKIEDLPSSNHQQYDNDALHAIPDVTWKYVKDFCPHLKVHFVCVSISTYDVIMKFITRSIPLYNLHIDNGFCPALQQPQILLFSTLKMLQTCFNQTLRHISIVLWHTTGEIDSSLEQFIKNMPKLRCFQYYGPVTFKKTINKLCDAALLSPELVSFKLMIQGDPCYPHIAQETTADLYEKYRAKFAEQSIEFMLGTHN